jgi:hypothetical protein
VDRGVFPPEDGSETGRNPQEDDMIEIKKRTEATQSHGRGTDNVYTPAKYTIFQDGVQVGVISGQPKTPWKSGRWDVWELPEGATLPRTIKSFWIIDGGLKAAKEWSKKHWGA